MSMTISYACIHVHTEEKKGKERKKNSGQRVCANPASICMCHLNSVALLHCLKFLLEAQTNLKGINYKICPAGRGETSIAGARACLLILRDCSSHSIFHQGILQDLNIDLMMIGSSREEETSTKQELPRSHEKVQTGSRIWSSALKNPRIVRVGRSFGGKDRHSKVSTVRGLRDRRIRLSVPTAIQLYDLQDKLGLSQPSKVVDWLLNAAQHEIDKLPPLQMPPESLMQFPHQPRATSRRKAASGEPSYFFHDNGSAQQLALSDTNLADGGGQSVLSKSSQWNSIATPGNKGKETARESGTDAEKSSCMIDKRSGSGNQEVGLVISNAMPHGSYYQLEPPNSSLSHLSAAEVPHGHHLIMPKLQYSHFQMIQLASEGFHDQNPFTISQQSVDNPNFLVLQPNYVFRNHGANNQGHNGS